jgi:hypothetical protein
MHRFTLTAYLLVLSSGVCWSVENLPSVSLKASLTTSSRLFYDIDTRDELGRTPYVELYDIFGIGIDVRQSIDDTRMQIGLSVEYLTTREGRVARIGSSRIPVEDGFWVVPVELTGYFVIPFSSDTYRLYIGGGAGMYIGERIYSVAGERGDVVDSRHGFGIHVVTGFEYSPVTWFAVRSELKFRDLQFDSATRFSGSAVPYVGAGPIRARVNVDGMLLDVGIVLQL